jgi:hypothetical protein
MEWMISQNSLTGWRPVPKTISEGCYLIAPNLENLNDDRRRVAQAYGAVEEIERLLGKA